MQDEEKLDAFIQATVDDTLEGLEDLLPPEAMACVRGRLVDDLHVHPELSRMAREHAPREPQAHTDEGVHPDILAEVEGKKHE